MTRRRAAVVLACALCLVTQAQAGGLAPRLEEALLSAGPDDRLPVVVMMEAKAVDNALLERVRAMNRKDRREHVVARLKSVTQTSQAPVRELLASMPGDPSKARTLLGVNGLALTADPATIRKLADVPGVRWVLLDRGGGHPDLDDAGSSFAGLRPTRPYFGNGGGPTGGDTSGPNPSATVRPEIVAMGAEDVWNLGFTGAGVIVAIIDTGFDRTHPDLADHVWTNLDEVPDNGQDDDGNGYIDDTWGWDFCLDSNDATGTGIHGTQVAGQVAGDGANGTVTGMAPDAELMALGIDCDTPSIGWEASDYAIAKGAHIISQSYSWWWTDQPDYEAFRRQTDAELAAGVIHSNSAGNFGNNPTYPIPYNISTPGNTPAPWLHPEQNPVGGISSMIGVGNIDWFFDTLEFSSSRGPSAWEDIQANTDPGYPHTTPIEYQDYPYENGAQPGLIKPDISAYGQSTESTCPGGGYCSFGGTSAAQPKVAGTLALMLSASPEATPARLAEALLTTAQHRGTPGMNNDYGVGLVQAFPAVELVQSDILYHSHAIDDIDGGNGDLKLDPGERVTLRVTVHSVTDAGPIDGVEAVLSTSTPGVEVHNQIASFPTVLALSTAESLDPHYSFTVDPGTCASSITFDLELRFEGQVRLTTFDVRVGDVDAVTLLHDDFETDQGWTPDPGTGAHGFWVREDPIESRDFNQRSANPADDTTAAGTHCWVTGNGGPLFDITANDVDGGTVTLTSPPFGSSNMITLDLQFDRWFYGPSSAPGDSYEAEVSNDGGNAWTTIETLTAATGGWTTRTIDLLALLPATDDMRIRFSATDAVPPDSVIESAIDEVRVSGLEVECQEHTPPAAQPPNPVGATLRVDKDAGGHAVLAWDAPPVDGGHDPATLYRVDHATSGMGPFGEIGSATATTWLHVDELIAPGDCYYLVGAENAGGSE